MVHYLFRNKQSLQLSTMDLLADAMDGMKVLPFGMIHQFGVVCAPQEFVARTRIRVDEQSKAQYPIRLAEGKFSLEWLLDQRDDVAWIVNNEGQLSLAASDVIGIAREYRYPVDTNRKVGEALLSTINQLIDEL